MDVTHVAIIDIVQKIRSIPRDISEHKQRFESAQHYLAAIMYTRPSLACKNNTNLSITSINQSRNYRHTYFWLAKLMFWGMISFCQERIDVTTCTFSRFITCIYPTFHWICYDASFLFNYHWRGIWLEFKKVYTTERQIGYNKTYMEPVYDMHCPSVVVFSRNSQQHW